MYGVRHSIVTKIINYQLPNLHFTFTVCLGGGGGGMIINENSPRKWPKTHSQKLFISLFRIMSSVKKERDIAID